MATMKRKRGGQDAGGGGGGGGGGDEGGAAAHRCSPEAAALVTQLVELWRQVPYYHTGCADVLTGLQGVWSSPLHATVVARAVEGQAASLAQAIAAALASDATNTMLRAGTAVLREILQALEDRDQVVVVQQVCSAVLQVLDRGNADPAWLTELAAEFFDAMVPACLLCDPVPVEVLQGLMRSIGNVQLGHCVASAMLASAESGHDLAHACHDLLHAAAGSEDFASMLITNTLPVLPAPLVAGIASQLVPSGLDARALVLKYQNAIAQQLVPMLSITIHGQSTDSVRGLFSGIHAALLHTFVSDAVNNRVGVSLAAAHMSRSHALLVSAVLADSAAVEQWLPWVQFAAGALGGRLVKELVSDTFETVKRATHPAAQALMPTVAQVLLVLHISSPAAFAGALPAIIRSWLTSVPGSHSHTAMLLSGLLASFRDEPRAQHALSTAIGRNWSVIISQWDQRLPLQTQISWCDLIAKTVCDEPDPCVWYRMCSTQVRFFGDLLQEGTINRQDRLWCLALESHKRVLVRLCTCPSVMGIPIVVQSLLTVLCFLAARAGPDGDRSAVEEVMSALLLICSHDSSGNITSQVVAGVLRIADPHGTIEGMFAPGQPDPSGAPPDETLDHRFMKVPEVWPLLRQCAQSGWVEPAQATSVLQVSFAALTLLRRFWHSITSRKPTCELNGHTHSVAGGLVRTQRHLAASQAVLEIAFHLKAAPRVFYDCSQLIPRIAARDVAVILQQTRLLVLNSLRGVEDSTQSWVQALRAILHANVVVVADCAPDMFAGLASLSSDGLQA